MTVITATTPAEFEEILNDGSRLEAMLKAGEFGEFVKNYAGAVKDKDASIAEQVKEQCATVLADMLKNEPSAAKRPNLANIDTSGPAKYATLQNERAVGSPLNGVFADLPTFMDCVNRHRLGREMSPENRKAWSAQMIYQEKVPGDGGFLVPEEFRAELLRLSLESAVVRPRARVIPMSSLTLSFPGIDTTTNSGSVFGGIQVFRTEEAAALVASQASFMKIKLEATKQTALATVTNELVNDAAGGFGMYITSMFPEAIAFYEDVDFLKGTGVGEPVGALTSANPAIVQVAKESGQTGNTIVAANVFKMFSRLLPTSMKTAVWIVTPDALPQLFTLTTGNNGVNAVWTTDLHGSPVLTLLGLPVVISEKAPATAGTQGDISLVDLNYYLIGDRQQMSLESSEHVGFRNDTTDFRVIQRNDGRPWLQSAVTPQNGGPTLSAFVQLQSRP